MSHPWITPLAALGLTSLLGSLLAAACTPRAPIEPAALDIPARGSAATAGPTAAPNLPPTGPGSTACGATRCRTGAEICCLGEPARCVPAPPAPADGAAYSEAAARQKACGTDHFLACDDAGDCGPGHTCCEETFTDETTSLWQGACRPLRAGRVACERAELCSTDDARCTRKDNACADVGGTRRCQLPLALRSRPQCGKQPCPAGKTCVEGDAGPTCVEGLFRNEIPVRTGVLECNRGRDCGEDESCYDNPQLPGRRCDFSLAGIDGLSERAHCTGPEDCSAYCRHDKDAVPNCHGETKGRSGRCECLRPCTKDADCGEECRRLAALRDGGDPGVRAYCDRRKGACECRAGRR